MNTTQCQVLHGLLSQQCGIAVILKLNVNIRQTGWTKRRGADPRRATTTPSPSWPGTLSDVQVGRGAYLVDVRGWYFSSSRFQVLAAGSGAIAATPLYILPFPGAHRGEKGVVKTYSRLHNYTSCSVTFRHLVSPYVLCLTAVVD